MGGQPGRNIRERRPSPARLGPKQASPKRFRALSLDLWFTTLYYTPERDDQWKEDRARFLRDSLRARKGRQVELGAVRDAIETVHDRLRAQGQEPIAHDPSALIPLYLGVLDAELTVPIDGFAQAYSSIGLKEHPPIANPEAISVVRALTERGIPVILITNSARRESTWAEYLHSQWGIEFRHVISSCDLGVVKPDPRIFREATRRTGLPADKILHVGDRWELDVEGARGAGLGAALYRGLWRFYPPGEYSDREPSAFALQGVPCVDSLHELLDPHFPT